MLGFIGKGTTFLKSPLDSSLTKEMPALPHIDMLKTTASLYIGGNPHKKEKAYDFRGYPKRKEIYDGFATPHDEQFVLPAKLCPINLTKHK